MSPTPSASTPTDAFDAWLPVALADPTGHGYGDARSAIFDADRADRDGPISQHLLTRCEHPVPEVRQRVLQLLTDMCSDNDDWDAAADNALLRLHDPDPQVRRSAAWLLAAARFEQARALTQDPHSADALAPDARLALVEAVFSWTRPITAAGRLALAERLRDDQDAAVRLRAALAALRIAPEEQWPAWEALALQCLPIAGTRLGRSGNWLRGRAGWLWSVAMVRQEREHAAYAWAARLLAHRSPVVRLAGLDLAHGALRQWRAAPDHLAEVLEAALDDAHTAVRAEALLVVAACLETTRRCVDRLASLVDDPALRTEAALALGRIGDQRAAETVLGLVRDASVAPGLSEAADSLARHCPDPGPWIAAADEALATAPDSCPTDDSRSRRGCALAGAFNVVTSLGSAAAPLVPRLLDLLSEPASLPTNCRSWARRRAVAALAAIGPAAAAAGPALERHVSGTEFPASAVLALAAITGDREHAELYLDQLPITVRTAGTDVDLMEWLTDHGGLADRHAARLNAMLQRRRRIHPRALRLLWRHQGSAAVDLLLETLPAYLTDDLYGVPACMLLAEMGTLAQPAVAALEAIVHRRTRIGMYIGDEDEELRADERLTEAAAVALAQLARE
ncbi:HEAT repeat domain-containing protein [Kitasatospora sp. NPDC101155]|uniref:HEAT repeat domain-containing protein n=1 Tax=Kitasatospora sp. NPDC101155 TaxID=3364097 RepID=UPI0038035DE9